MLKIDGITEFTGQWAILPARVRYDKRLPANAKLIYAEIAAKINEEGFCFCHNAYFSERLGIKRDTVSTLIKRLEDAEYIRIGDRIVLAPISGSYVVLGAVGLPARKYNMNQCPTGSNATAENCANWINTIIEALTAQGLMSKNGW